MLTIKQITENTEAFPKQAFHFQHFISTYSSYRFFTFKKNENHLAQNEKSLA